MLRILFIGDIVGRPGRDCLKHGLAALVEAHHIDLVIANVENAAAGFGITREIGDQFLDWGVDVMTSGNHIWAKKEAIDYIGAEPRLLRPANFPTGVPGNGSYLARSRDGRSIGVVNVMGRVFMTSIDDPFSVVLREIDQLRQRTKVIFVDFHAEATSEKIAMGWHLDGRVTAVVGTHTHVQTADERILPGINDFPGNKLVAVVSRDQGRANAVAKKFGAQHAYTSYDETVYMLDVPTDRDGPATLAVLTVHHWADRARGLAM